MLEACSFYKCNKFGCYNISPCTGWFGVAKALDRMVLRHLNPSFGSTVIHKTAVKPCGHLNLLVT